MFMRNESGQWKLHHLGKCQSQLTFGRKVKNNGVLSLPLKKVCRTGFAGLLLQGLDAWPRTFLQPQGISYPYNAKHVLVHLVHGSSSIFFTISFSIPRRLHFAHKRCSELWVGEIGGD